MKRTTIVILAIVVLLISLFLASRAGATATKGQVGDECDVNAEDESHMCLRGLTCVPQNENSQGNGKCEDLNVSTPTPTPTASPEDEPTDTPTPEPIEQPKVDDGGDGKGCAVFDCSGQHGPVGISPYDGSVVGMK